MDGVYIFDGHNDAIKSMIDYTAAGRDFLVRSESGHLDLPRAREGRMAGGLFAMSAYPEREPENDLTITSDGYEVRYADTLDPSDARRQIDGQVSAIKALVDRSNRQIHLATSVTAIRTALNASALAVVLHMEGAEAIDVDLSYLDTLYDHGLRSLGIVWSRPNIFGFGVPFAYPRSPDTGAGLTDAGKRLVKRCNDLGILIDVSHLNERGFWDVAALSTSPLVATHACAHTICPSTRNLTDRQLDAIRETDGVIGFNLAVNDMRADGNLDDDTPLDVVVRHIEYLLGRVGIDRVALGSDFDGAVMPRDIKDASGLPRLIEAMRKADFDEADIRKFAFDNWLRVFGLTWKKNGAVVSEATGR
ncbi:membrane dipeptidase [Agrobacterium rhizogenes]|uniref:dipeptidase n=1 Tax=Rhizobium rhizogenes TaxID=359 RepID=UPI00115EB4A6|nr:dipeptidase [Rhizobium rhizogenes]NTG20669.1 membrane dipeptidase [Rhizobium rhizogenes]NTH38167.1 membrane dipeptidase [Rhizobium rhizogenes]NTI03127.1 membrane dipeptidase [Rhizobium rhizogenes]NTI09931.1 membrane dipeptidase [Rhizobium rhizogenes]NTJ00597.1 membrane dipeptidase [Rhizobium rhizogenes]